MKHMITVYGDKADKIIKLLEGGGVIHWKATKRTGRMSILELSIDE